MLTKIAPVTPRQLTDALNEANAACLAYTQPEEIRPGVRLCPSGRVMRAMHLAADLPLDKWAVAHAEIDRLARLADERLRHWIDAERRYRDLCQEAGVEPVQITPGEACGCEGCQLVAEGIEAVQKLPALPSEQWKGFRSMVDAQAAYDAVKDDYEAMICIDREKNLFVLCAPPSK
jgi:hypothetical protein